LIAWAASHFDLGTLTLPVPSSFLTKERSMTAFMGLTERISSSTARRSLAPRTLACTAASKASSAKARTARSRTKASGDEASGKD